MSSRDLGGTTPLFPHSLLAIPARLNENKVCSLKLYGRLVYKRSVVSEIHVQPGLEDSLGGLLSNLQVTPIGIAIGIGVGSSYQENSELALGFQGSFNSVSAGILIYNGLVDLLIPTFSSTLLLGNKLLQFVAVALVFCGFACMSLIAKWA